MKSRLIGLIETERPEAVEAQEGAFEAEAEVGPETELSTLLTQEGSEILKDTVGMIKWHSDLKTARVGVEFAPGGREKTLATQS